MVVGVGDRCVSGLWAEVPARCTPVLCPHLASLPRLAVGAWSTCVPRKAPLVAASSREDEQKAAAALEAVGVGPSQKASPLSMSGPR